LNVPAVVGRAGRQPSAGGWNAVRWTTLFADLEAQADALDVAQRAAEVSERTRIEAGKLAIADRVRAAVGGTVRLQCVGGGLVHGQLLRVHGDWLLIDEEYGREAVVPLGAVTSIAGVNRFTERGPDGIVESRLGLRHVLRALARDRSRVDVQLLDGTIVSGTIDRVAADFVELATHPAGELRRRVDVHDVLVVPVAALAVVRHG
jgi:hypothetical protein